MSFFTVLVKKNCCCIVKTSDAMRGSTRVMLAVSKQTVMEKNVTICNIKLSQHTSKCDGIVLKNVIMKFDSDSPKKKMAN